MKKVLVSLLLSLGLVGTSYAETNSGLYVNGSPTTYLTNGFNGISGVSGEQSFVFGALMSAQAGTLTFTFLGSEAGHTDKFFSLGNNSFSNKSTATNATFSTSVSASQQLTFSFTDVSSNTIPVANGALVSGWGQSGANSWQNTFGMVRETNGSYLLMYNDYVSGGDRDYDDMVVRVSLAPIPEPETYAMFLAGLGLMGFMSRRRSIK